MLAIACGIIVNTLSSMFTVGSYGTMDSCRSNDERDDEIATIHPPSEYH